MPKKAIFLLVVGLSICIVLFMIQYDSSFGSIDKSTSAQFIFHPKTSSKTLQGDLSKNSSTFYNDYTDDLPSWLYQNKTDQKPTSTPDDVDLTFDDLKLTPDDKNDVDYFAQYLRDAAENTTAPKTTKTPHAERRPTQVILLTYMRGGSTLLGELFNLNSDAMYWFEPLNGMYQSYYGLDNHPIDFFFSPDHRIRKLPSKEEKLIHETLDNILECTPDLLSTGVLTSKFMKNGRMKSLRTYISCLLAEENAFQRAITTEEKFRAAFSSNTKTRIPGAPLSDICRLLIRDVSPKAVSISPLAAEACANHISRAAEINDAARYTSTSSGEARSLKQFLARDRCERQGRLGYNRCAEFTREACERTSIRAVKVIRLQMATAISYLKRNPNVKVIWYMRDPRGIINSRMKLRFLSFLSDGNPGVEIKLLCRKIMSDVEAFDRYRAEHNLNEEFSAKGRILPLRYEDLIADPVGTLNKVYSFTGEKVPEGVKDWLVKSLHAEEDVKGLFGMQRLNASATATEWQTKIPFGGLKFIEHECEDVLKRFKYV